jgi:hypothetical protein
LTAEYPIMPPKILKKIGTRYHARVGLAIIRLVSCCRPTWPTAEPHEAQNRPPSEMCEPHFSQKGKVFSLDFESVRPTQVHSVTYR